MPHLLQTPFDRAAEPDDELAPEYQLSAAHHPNDNPDYDVPRLRAVPPAKPPYHWWGLAADGCYIVLEAGKFLMACWVMALGLPLMFLLLLTGGQMDMVFTFLGSLFGGFADASPDRQYTFASQATWCLLALATAIAAWRLPRFLDVVSDGLNDWRKVL